MPETSVIIRTKKEEKWLGECLKRLRAQTYQNFEIVVVDSGSTDRTLTIAGEFDARIHHIKQEEFSYPFALNYGCERAAAFRYLVFLSGHSLPISNTWLQDGIDDFVNDKIMGVYGFVWALPDGSIWEKIIFNEYRSRIKNLFRGKTIIDHDGMGVLGFTNAMIRKDLWDQHHFDEAYGAGGEDGAWARYWFIQKYVAVRDIKFSVYHSHGLNRRQLKEQWRYWVSLGEPRPFKPLVFRRK